MADLLSCAAAEKPVAWCGLSLAVPEQWEPGLLDPGALRIDHRAGPALELKWTRLASFDPARQIDKVARRFKTARFIRKGEPGLPPDWKRAVKERADKRTEAEPFAWLEERTGERALGAALYFKPSRTAVLLQCFLSPGDESCELPARVLATLADHGAAERTPWTVFGLHAEVPTRFRLASHSFRPGHFRITLAAEKRSLLPLGRPCELTLERFGPASVLLGHERGPEALAAWAETQYPKPLPRQAIELDGDPEGERVRLAGCKSRREIWTEPGANKILALTMRRARRADLDQFDEIRRSHGTT